MDLVVLDSAAAGIDFRRLPWSFWNIRVLIKKRQCGRPPRWAQPTWGHLGPQARPDGLCSHRSTPRCFSVPLDVFWSKKSPKSFAAFGLRLVLISCDAKNMQKTTTSTWHYVNRLVPKMTIK